ncbi:MAG TPA: universal stress protein [Vicinamibacterales bacterium]|nr:universal stress protein [Vicinamibacterales bacterium]
MKILLAVDGSEASDAAIDEVRQRPWPKGSTVRVLSVVQQYMPSAPDVVLASMTFEEIRARLSEEAEQLTRAAAERVAAPSIMVETDVRQGDPRTAILDAADEWKADLIVVGSHGRTGLQRLVMGSVAQSVVAHARCSVEVVRPRRRAA